MTPAQSQPQQTHAAEQLTYPQFSRQDCDRTQFTAVAATYGAADSIVIGPGGHAVRPKILDILNR
ncbi:hypothetical protein DFH08DRAFT_960075 [Mycena albidolilacea]|uniref:Uncharacterized protein n=1 Tax=Mycena albidolilacea TaxID=1033008 RepID=A0AAD7ETY1_9AGAR|nr:hypothetical protein DFH08DRAFT_960075 [Mycena albidolilacea]